MVGELRNDTASGAWIVQFRWLQMSSDQGPLGYWLYIGNHTDHVDDQAVFHEMLAKGFERCSDCF